jgi:hypothetical protein
MHQIDRYWSCMKRSIVEPGCYSFLCYTDSNHVFRIDFCLRLSGLENFNNNKKTKLIVFRDNVKTPDLQLPENT